MKKILIIPAVSLALVSCGLLTEEIPGDPVVSQPAATPTVVEAPLPEAREALKGENGEILSTEENMWRNRDESSDSRS